MKDRLTLSVTMLTFITVAGEWILEEFFGEYDWSTSWKLCTAKAYIYRALLVSPFILLIPDKCWTLPTHIRLKISADNLVFYQDNFLKLIGFYFLITCLLSNLLKRWGEVNYITSRSERVIILPQLDFISYHLACIKEDIWLYQSL